MKNRFFMRLSGLVFSLLLVAALTLVSCGPDAPDVSSSSDGTSSSDITLLPTPADNYKPHIAVLNGTTGFGIAPLYQSFTEGKADYIDSIDFYADPALISPQFIQGSIDIAAVPTNLASVLFNKTGGNVKVIAVNTLGVLYILENGNTVSSLSSLEGKTVCVPGQGSNPEYVLRAILKLSGLEDKVTIDYTYTNPDELTTAVASGKASIALLPEPKVSAALSKNAGLRVALDISAEWKNVTGADLIQGCLIAGEKFCEEHPSVLGRFLTDYSSSVNLLNADPANAADIIVNVAKLAPSTSLVESALPRCNIVCQTGAEIAAPLNNYWKALFDIIPSSVGGALPTDGIFLK
ncbi:MAG: ABC transporter substrate-binding protein [Clostridia bacterium]|nr:ABC transporter substrate-binding protein [Clostridia bacterium]